MKSRKNCKVCNDHVVAKSPRTSANTVLKEHPKKHPVGWLKQHCDVVWHVLNLLLYKHHVLTTSRDMLFQPISNQPIM